MGFLDEVLQKLKNMGFSDEVLVVVYYISSSYRQEYEIAVAYDSCSDYFILSILVVFFFFFLLTLYHPPPYLGILSTFTLHSYRQPICKHYQLQEATWRQQ